MKIMLVDDEPNIRSLVKVVIEEAGFKFCEAEDGKQALSVFESERPDLLILDIMMPKLSGFDVCEQIRKVNRDIPVILLSAKDDIVDKQSGYRAGADDYMTKPFVEEELILHIGALLRRRMNRDDATDSWWSNRVQTVGDFSFDFRKCEVSVKGKKAGLTLKEFQILALLARYAEEVLTHEEIIRRLWGEEYTPETISIAVYIRRIREKIEEYPSKPVYLQTIWRVGYRLCPEG
jgi:two-component system response regulator VicR